MATNWGGGLSGAATGASLGSFLGPIGTGVGAIGGGLIGLFSGKKKEEELLKDARTEEQKRAQAALMQLAESGSYGGINLGELYSGNLGSYNTSGLDKSYSQLQDLYGGSELTTAGNTLSQLTDLKFNPDDPSSGYAAFSRALAKSGQESADVLNQEAAMTGGRFGTGIQRQKASLAEDLANQRGSYLAQLYQNQRNTALQAAQGLTGLAGTKGNIAINAAQQQQFANAVKDQQAKDMYSEYKRGRNEQLSRIDLLQTEANRNPYLGIDTTGTTQSPFSTLANSVLGSLGQKIGSNSGNWLGNLFKGSSSSGTFSAGSPSSFSNVFA
jgi:hypothetical protein